MSEVWNGVVAALIGGTAGYATGWINQRMSIVEQMRGARTIVYSEIWRISGRIPKWPRATISRDQMLDLHIELKDWYFGLKTPPAGADSESPGPGGLFLSEVARARYGKVQEAIALVLDKVSSTSGPDPVSEAHYDKVQEAMSDLRTELTTDLLSRRRGLRK
jgi:hypothetical protein